MNENGKKEGAALHHPDLPDADCYPPTQQQETGVADRLAKRRRTAEDPPEAPDEDEDYMILSESIEHSRSGSADGPDPSVVVRFPAHQTVRAFNWV